MDSNEQKTKIFARIGGNVEFVKIKAGTKKPLGSFKAGSTNRFSEIPKTKNYGIIPRGNLIILDIDTHRGINANEQIRVFSEILGLDLRKTLTVKTPSGGLHFYLRISSNVDKRKLPKTSLRNLAEEISTSLNKKVEIDADIRTSVVNAYVLGPGSATPEGEYIIKYDRPIRFIPTSGIENLINLNELRLETKKLKAKKVDLWEDEPRVLSDTLKFNTMPPKFIMNRLRIGLQRRNSFHQKRAYVKSALHCCYTNDTIAKVCIELEINKDSFSAKPIPRFLLQEDIASFEPYGKTHSKYYCPKKASEKELIPFEEYLRNAKEKYINNSVAPPSNRNPRVVDYEWISNSLLSQIKRKEKSIQYKNCMMVVEGIIQPLVNIGANKILLSHSIISSELGLSVNQAREVLRLLRARKIIVIADNQKPGFAATYHVNKKFINIELTNEIKTLSGKTEYFLWEPRSGGFQDLEKNTITNDKTLLHSERQCVRLDQISTKEISTKVVEKYLKLG